MKTYMYLLCYAILVFSGVVNIHALVLQIPFQEVFFRRLKPAMEEILHQLHDK